MDKPTRTLRTRWAAIGAAIAVSLGAGLGSGVLTTSAATSPAESTFVPVEPIRILDTRPSDNVGLTGKFVSNFDRDLQVTGVIDTAEGASQVVPAGATGVVLNVTAVRAAAPGFISVTPGGTLGTTSNLNFLAGEITPNAVTVPLSSDGAITIVYTAAAGTGADVDVLVDLVGYTTQAGLLDTQRRLNTLEATSPVLAAHDSVDQNVSIGLADTVLATIEIPYQQNGDVVVNASVSQFNSIGANPSARCSITRGGAIDATAVVVQSVPNGEFASMSLTRGFSVFGSNTSNSTDPLLTFTANLVCDSLVGTIGFADPNLTATYVPVDPETFAGG